MTFKTATKNYFFAKHNFSKKKNHKEVTKQYLGWNQGFSYYICLKNPDPELDPDPYLVLTDPDLEFIKHRDPTDPDPAPDPQH